MVMAVKVLCFITGYCLKSQINRLRFLQVLMTANIKMTVFGMLYCVEIGRCIRGAYPMKHWSVSVRLHGETF